MRTLAPTFDPAPTARLRWLVSDSLTFARRSLAHVRQVPEKLMDATLQPLMFVLLFAYVFGGVIDVPGGDYREYLIAGIFVQTLAFAVVGPGVSMATDLTEGIVDRFRSLPISRSSFVLGHVIAEFAAIGVAMVVLTVSGLIVGWRIHSDLVDAIAGFGLLALFGLAMLWIGTLIGIVVRSADAVMGIAFTVVFPLSFLSNAFVPIDGLPSALQALAEWNPMSAMVAAVRDLFGNPVAVPADAAWPLQHPVLAAVLWCVALLAVAIPLTARLFRARTTE